MKVLAMASAKMKLGAVLTLPALLVASLVSTPAFASEGVDSVSDEVTTSEAQIFVEQTEDQSEEGAEETPALEDNSPSDVPTSAPLADAPVGTLKSMNRMSGLQFVPQSTPAVVTPDIHSVRYSTIASSYNGVVVDSYMRNFADATSFRAIIHRADGSDAVREGGVDTLAHINSGGNKALTVPFNFAGSGAGVWFGSQSSIWLPSQRPVGVTIEIMTESHGLISFSTPISQVLVEKNGLYGDITPAYLPSTTLVVEGAEDGLVGSTFTVSGDAYSALGLNRVYVQLVHRETSQRFGGTTINLLPEGTNAHWSRTYTVDDSLPEGTYAAHVQVVDASGGRTDVGWTSNFVLDKTMPSFEIVSPVNNSLVRGTQRVTVKITDANDIVKVLVNVGDGHGNYAWEAGKAGNVTRDGDLFHLDVDTTKLADGVNHVVLRATDGAGNTRYFNNNAKLRQHAYEVDNNKPMAEIVAPDNVEGDVEIRGVASDNHVIKSHWFEVKAPDGVLYYKNFPGTSTAEVSFQLADVAPIIEGDYVIRYVVADKAGNRNDDPGFTNSEVHVLTVTFPVVVSEPPVTPNAPASTGKTGGGEKVPSSTTVAAEVGDDTTVAEEGDDASDGDVSADEPSDSNANAGNSSSTEAQESAGSDDASSVDGAPAADFGWLGWMAASVAAAALLLWLLVRINRRKS